MTRERRKLDLEQFISREQEEMILGTRLWKEGAPLESDTDVKVDLRFGWDFAVRTEGDRIRVTFSIPLGDRRWRGVVKECARAIEEVREGRRESVFRGRGPLAQGPQAY